MLITLKKHINILFSILILVCFSCKELFDVIPPELEIMQPRNNETVGRTFDVILDVNDNDAIESVEIKLFQSSGDSWTLLQNKTLDTQPWKHTFSLSFSGKFQLRVLVKDEVGNFEEKEREFFISTSSSSDELTVIYPNGNEFLNPGSTYEISWSSYGLDGQQVGIELYRNYNYTSSISSSTANDGSFYWAIPSSMGSSGSHQIKIYSTTNPDIYDLSDTFFTISSSQQDPSITVVNPGSGDNWETGSSQTITWQSSGVSGDVGIQLYEWDNYISSINSSTANDGSYTWNIPSNLSESIYYNIKIYSNTDSDIYDYSDGYFAVTGYGQSITVLTPNGSEYWKTGSSQTITWQSNGVSGYVGIQLYRNNNYLSALSSSTSNDGSFSWSIPSNLAESNYYQIRIYSTADSDINDLSDGYFEIYTVGEDTTFYLNENWEGGDYSGWLTAASGSSNWVVTDTESYQGNNSAMSGSVSASGQYSYIYKEIDTPSNGYLRVRYQMWVTCEGSSQGDGGAHVYLEVQGNGSSTWNELFHLTGQSSYGWSEYSSTINLNSIATPPKLQWRIEGDWGDCSCYVDNIKVYQE